MAYQPIESYGVIGDLHTAALVNMNGSIDWLCLPRFDSPSVFGALLDDGKGGYFSIRPEWWEQGTQKQMYFAETNVLLSRFLSAGGVAEVADFMPVREKDGEQQQLIRVIRAVRQEVRFRLECVPAFDYARTPHSIRLINGHGAVFESSAGAFSLVTPIEVRRENGGIVGEFTLRENESLAIALRWHADGDAGHDALEQPVDGEQLLTDTVRFWRTWMSHCQYRGRWREVVNRSALALKLLTYRPTGAVLAAATTSLPESIGGVRNWDYRYTWVRDAAFTVYALMRLGYTQEAGEFTHFIHQRSQEQESRGGPLNVMYGIDGRHELNEIELTHLDGYMGSRPVRIGNDAWKHLQLDVYGELMDSVYLHDKYGTRVSWDVWSGLVKMLDWVAENWTLDDQSIWEVRGGRKPFTYSKLQCWVALDRGIRLAQKRSLPSPAARWWRERDRIYETIMKEAWDPGKQAFTQYFGSNALDAGALLMPLMLFIGPKDPRIVSTIDAIQRELTTDTLVYRYRIGEAASDGLPGHEGTFSICSFWLVEALTRAGRVEEAQTIFEKMLTYANHVGLFSEQIGPAGEALGNFPQAFTHLGLISAAYDLDRALDER